MRGRWDVEVDNAQWGMSKIRKHAIAVNNFWQTTKLPPLQKLQDKKNVVKKGSLWEALLFYAKTDKMGQVKEIMPNVEWPSDPSEIQNAQFVMHSLATWTSAPMRRMYNLSGVLGYFIQLG